MPDITFVLPPAPFLISPRTFPQLGVLYLTSVLKAKGFKVEVIDLLGGEPLPPIHSHIVGISTTTPTFPGAVKLLRELKSWGRERHWVICGGAHATVDPEGCLEAGFDQVVCGEGEEAILKIMAGDARKIVQEPYIKNLDTIPFPDRTAIDMDRYSYETLGVKATSIMSSRGCPWQCSFCCEVWSKPPRYHSATYTVQEAAELKRLGYLGLSFFDDEMLVRWERDHQIFQGLHSLGMTYRLLTRADLVSEEKASYLAKTGCQEVFLGLESGSDRVLKNIKKGTTRAINIQAVQLFQKYGIRVKTGIVIGLPGEDQESLRETESMLEEIQTEDVDFSLLQVMHGSPISKHPEQYDLKFQITHDHYKGTPGSYHPTISTSALSAEELLEARDRLERKFKKVELLR